MGNTVKTGQGDKRGKGSVASSTLLEAFASESKSNVNVGWDEASAQAVYDLVEVVIACGGALMFGRSRQGDVLSVTLFMDGDKRTRWIRPEEDPDTVLETLALPFEAMRD